jgi:MFS family permease
VRGRLLLDGNGRRQPLDVVHVGLFHHRQELPRVGGQGLHVAALALGVEAGVEGQRGLAGAGQAGDHDQLVAGQIEVDILRMLGLFRLWVRAPIASTALWVVPQPGSAACTAMPNPYPPSSRPCCATASCCAWTWVSWCLHMILTATFVVLPLVLRDELGLAAAEHWKLYLPVMLGSMLAVLPFIFLAERKRRLKPVFLAAILVLGLAEFGLFWLGDGLVALALWVFVFFAAFNLLEASLPSLVAKMAPPDSKGTAMGFYSSSQFLGAFLGGLLGGWLHARYGLQGVFLFCALAAGGWLLVALGMKNPRFLASYLLPIAPVTPARPSAWPGGSRRCGGWPRRWCRRGRRWPT